MTIEEGEEEAAKKLIQLQQKRAREKGHWACVLSIAFNPDGKTLTSGGMDGTVKLWDLVSETEQSTLERNDRKSGSLAYVYSVAFSQDGKTLAMGGNDVPDFRRSPNAKVWVLWDAGTGRELAALKGARIVGRPSCATSKRAA